MFLLWFINSLLTLIDLYYRVFLLIVTMNLALLLVFLPGLSMGKTMDSEGEAQFSIGVGRADCTGPAADVVMMGYAHLEQVTAGIHTRLYSRAFIMEDKSSQRTVFVSVEIGMMSQKVRLEVLKELKKDYQGLYTEKNVVLSGLHTHSGPGGYLQYSLFCISTLGYVPATHKTITNAILKSIKMAHDNMQPGNILTGRGLLSGSNINRSPYSYLNNPPQERSRYSNNVDEDMVLLKFVDVQNKPIGLISWFAVHPVSMNNTNRLISSDNMGYASRRFEQDMNPGFLPGEGPFVASFSSTNLGDVSPNTHGPHCSISGEDCNNLHSYCASGGKCYSSGPGKDMFESTKIIGENIYIKAKDVFTKCERKLSGPLQFAQQFVDMTSVEVILNSTHKVRTCEPALGYSFAAGTTDGFGAFNFTQGDTEGDPFWNAIVNVLFGPPSEETIQCHAPKPILLNTGSMSNPLPWHPTIVEVQILVLGDFAIIAVPGEFRTMSGRRLRDAVKKELSGMEVVIAGLSNVYTQYIATYEEYQVQRYEGASTIFGPHSLSAYIQLYTGLARAIVTNTTGSLPPGPTPPLYNDSTLITILKEPPVDKTPLGYSFGDVLSDAKPSYYPVSICVESSMFHGRCKADVVLTCIFLILC
uniref:Neutral ceramidase n=1 Tax=Eptatretus burgeri TaxID=7764 RepID=A0A8C4R6C8_EPTBU